MNQLEQEITSKGRFIFVADFVVKMTRKQADRELVNGYQVKRNKGQYKIFFNKADAGYGWMTAEDINSWFARLPLNYFAMQAEEMVIYVRMSD